MLITFEQFSRGIEAIQTHRRLVKSIYDVFAAAGEDRIDGLGGSGVLNELTRQLEERCNDPSFVYEGGSMIEYMLYEQGGPVELPDGRSFMVETPEALWAYWRETQCGPFEVATVPA